MFPEFPNIVGRLAGRPKRWLLCFLATAVLMLALPAQAADPLNNWISRHSGTSAYLEDITFANGTFVTVGQSGWVLTSSDGTTWTSRNSGTGKTLKGITFGCGKFVAVGNQGTIITSNDGRTWTTRNAGTTADLFAIAYGNGTFVASGWNGTVLTSTDGITWAGRNSGTTKDNLYAITYGNGIFVAAGQHGTRLASTDGITWHGPSSVVATSNSFWGIAYGNGQFVTVAEFGTIFTSKDGTTWTSPTTSSITDLLGITYGNGTFVALGVDGTILTSTDGTTWTSRNTGTKVAHYGITHGNGTFVSVGENGNIIQNSVTPIYTVVPGTVLPPLALAPAAPSNLTFKLLSSGKPELGWTDNSNNETGFKIERKMNKNGTWVQINTTATDKYTDISVQHGETYYYRVRAYNAFDSNYSNEVEVTMAPNIPANLTYTISGNTVELNWRDCINEQGFKVERKTSISGTYKQIATCPANSSKYTDTGVALGNTYYYRVCAYNSIGDSAYSSELQVAVSGKTSTPGNVPTAPSILTFKMVSPTSLELNWQDNSSNEQGFKVERKTGSGSYVQIDTAPMDWTKHTDTTLALGQTYTFRVCAYNGSGDSGYSNEVTVTTTAAGGTTTPPGGATTPPGGATPLTGAAAAPTGLRVNAVFPQEVELQWTDHSNNEDLFDIERKTTGGSFTIIDSTGPNEIQFVDIGLTTGATYYYRVKACNLSGCSVYSNTEQVTPQAGGPSPGGAVTTRTGTTTIELRVDDIFYTANGQGREMDAPPVSINGRTLLPIRYVAEPLGASVGWDAGEQKATVTLDGRVIELWIGNNRAVVDGHEEMIDPGNPEVVPIVLPPGRTMLPLRFVAETLGCEVDWDGPTKTVTVTSKP